MIDPNVDVIQIVYRLLEDIGDVDRIRSSPDPSNWHAGDFFVKMPIVSVISHEPKRFWHHWWQVFVTHQNGLHDGRIVRAAEPYLCQLHPDLGSRHISRQDVIDAWIKRRRLRILRRLINQQTDIILDRLWRPGGRMAQKCMDDIGQLLNSFGIKHDFCGDTR